MTVCNDPKVVLQAKKMNVGGSWNLKLIEDKIREKIHERVGGTNLFEVSYGRHTPHTQRGGGIRHPYQRIHTKKTGVIGSCACAVALTCAYLTPCPPAVLPQVQAAYTLFQDGRNTGLTKKGFQAQMHDKFAVVLSQKVIKHYGRCLSVHRGVLLLRFYFTIRDKPHGDNSKKKKRNDTLGDNNSEKTRAP